jgi:hypothetical protein
MSSEDHEKAMDEACMEMMHAAGSRKPAEFRKALDAFMDLRDAKPEESPLPDVGEDEEDEDELRL